MRKTGRSLVDCYCEVKKSRSKVHYRTTQVNPNEGFLQQLKKYEDKLKDERSPNRPKIEIPWTPEPRLRTRRHARDKEPDLNMSVDLGDKIQPIDIEARIQKLRSRYSSILNNPQEDGLVSHISHEIETKPNLRKPSCLLGVRTRDPLGRHTKSKSCFHPQNNSLLDQLAFN